MRILVINCGSSTLKSSVIDIPRPEEGHKLVEISIDRIGDQGMIKTSIDGGVTDERPLHAADHSEAVEHLLKWLDESGILESGSLEAVGHRFVHGGVQFMRPTIVDEQVLEGMELVSKLAPLHNGPSLNAIRTARSILGPSIPMVAVFDTSFHRTMPQYASEYAIPHALASRHNIRRYGFHGIAHQYMTERYARLTSKPLDEVNIITLQLGNGCSAAAIKNGRSVDTSMGLTPLEGLMMGTRSGDVDPSLSGFLARSEGVPVDEVENWLNRQSGMLGVSGYSSDMRELLDAEGRGEPGAALAVEMFCYRARKYLGAYMAVLGGTDAVVFGGGIGGNSPPVRSRICEGMKWCGLELDSGLNDSAVGMESRISSGNSAVKVYVMRVDEEMLIARETAACL